MVGTLDASYGRLQGCSGQDANHGHSHLVPVAFSHQAGGTQTTLGYDPQSKTAPSLAANQTPAVVMGADTFNGALTGDIAATMGTRGSSETASGPVLLTGTQVRRLTPRECERLQGFPDDYTLIPLPLKKRQTRVRWAADGPRYKALGNSWAVPCARWIGQRINEVEAIQLEKVAA